MSDPSETPPEATEGHSGAHAHEALTEARVVEVVELMMAGTFRRGSTVRELAQRWGVGEHRAREITALASRRVRAQLTDPDELAAEVVPALLEALHAAVAKEDARGVAALGAQLLEVGGLKTKRTELSGPGGGAIPIDIDLSTLTDEELEAFARGGTPEAGASRA